jgi:hypothetical protein
VNVERPANRARRGGVIATVAWLAVLGGTVALGVAGRASGDRTTVIAPIPSRATPVALPDVARRPLRSPLPTRPPIGEDGIMGGLPFGTAWEWLESD